MANKKLVEVTTSENELWEKLIGLKRISKMPSAMINVLVKDMPQSDALFVAFIFYFPVKNLLDTYEFIQKVKTLEFKPTFYSVSVDSHSSAQLWGVYRDILDKGYDLYRDPGETAWELRPK